MPFVEEGAEDPNATQVPEDAILIDLDTGDDTPSVGRPIQRWEKSASSIELEVDVADVETFQVGKIVGAELPDGQVVDAAVVAVSDVARTNQQSGQTVVDVSIAPVEEIDSLFTTGPVVVQIEDGSTLGAVLVPARALLALAEGGHAVEVDGRGLVGVELGTFDDGWVEITSGNIEAGEAVVVSA